MTYTITIDDSKIDLYGKILSIENTLEYNFFVYFTFFLLKGYDFLTTFSKTEQMLQEFNEEMEFGAWMDHFMVHTHIGQIW